MAKSVNKVILLGNVGKDPDSKQTGGGTNVVSFSIATSDRTKSRNGEYEDRTEWHNCKAFGKTADVISQYVHKGTKIYVEGKIQTNSWEDKNTGERRYKTEIIVNDVCLISSSDGETRTTTHTRKPNGTFKEGAESYVAPSAPKPGPEEISDEEIPF
jgi:single-strand DNA-binding protein